MKIININKKTQEGQLSIVDNVGRVQVLTFPLDTIFNWYPLCIRYEYRYSKKQDKLYLVLVEKNENCPVKYGVDGNSKRAYSNVACCDIVTWYSKEVSCENQKTIKFAKENNYPTPDQKYTLEDVQAGLVKIQDTLDTLMKVERAKFLKIAREHDPWVMEEFVYSDRETQASIILEASSKGTNELYRNLGEVYSMLTIMRKLKR